MATVDSLGKYISGFRLMPISSERRSRDMAEAAHQALPGVEPSGLKPLSQYSDPEMAAMGKVLSMFPGGMPEYNRWWKVQQRKPSSWATALKVLRPDDFGSDPVEEAPEWGEFSQHLDVPGSKQRESIPDVPTEGFDFTDVTESDYERVERISGANEREPAPGWGEHSQHLEGVSRGITSSAPDIPSEGFDFRDVLGDQHPDSGASWGEHSQHLTGATPAHLPSMPDVPSDTFDFQDVLGSQPDFLPLAEQTVKREPAYEGQDFSELADLQPHVPLPPPLPPMVGSVTGGALGMDYTPATQGTFRGASGQPIHRMGNLTQGIPEPPALPPFQHSTTMQVPGYQEFLQQQQQQPQQPMPAHSTTMQVPGYREFLEQQRGMLSSEEKARAAESTLRTKAVATQQAQRSLAERIKEINKL